MATITWTGAAGDGNYNNPANWSPAQVPGAADTVTISVSAATAINASNGAAGALTTSKLVTLNVSNQTSFTLGSSTSSTFANAGTLALNSTNQATELVIAAGTETLTGGGLIVLSNNGGNDIVGATASDKLVNTNNTIAGSGQLGDGTLTLVNNAGGIIDATNSTPLYVNTGAIAVTNAGLMEATGGGVLVLQSVIADGTAGKITAAGGTVYLQGGDIQGGTLSTSGGAAITVQGNFTGTLDGTAHAVDNTGLLAVNNQGTLSVLGSIVNTGTIALQSSNQATDLSVGPASGKVGTVTLSGAGTLTLSDNPGNRIYGAEAGDTLVNQSTISGAGSFGIGAGTYTLALVNQGTIDATGNNGLVINTGSTVSNTALMEATNPTGGLVLQATVNDSAGGTLLGAGANVYLQGADIVGGLLSSTGTGAIVVQGGQSATLDGSAHAVTNAGTLAINNQGTLSVLGSLVNNGLLALQSSNQPTELVVGPATGTAGTVTLTGTGMVTLSDNPNNYIFGAQAGDTLVNQTETIAGAGQLGDGTLTLVNHAIIDATGTNGLVINTGSTVVNSALMEATNPNGGLVVQATVNDSTGGTLLAAGANVYLQGADIIGGLVNSTGAGAIIIQGGYTATLDGSSQTVTIANQFDINNQGTLTALGTLTNDGTIALQSSNQTTVLEATSPTLTLTGGGVVSLSDNPGNYIYGATTATVLDNLNNTIQGSGQIGDGQLTLVNAGTISATGGNDLYINGDTLVTNTALMEASSGGGLVFQNTTVANSGTIAAVATNVLLQSATIQGGLLKTGATSAIEVQGGQVATLDGSASAVTNSGNLQIDNQGTVTVLGTLVNSGTITLNSSNQTTEFVIGSPTLTLTGGGQVNLSNNPGNYIFGSTAADVLDNVNNTITGAGQLGDGQMTLVNTLHGTINANQTTGLVLNTSGETATNAGLIEATGTGGLTISSTTISNTGTILANGGNVYLSSGDIAGGAIAGAAGGQFVVNGSNIGTLDGSAKAVTSTAIIDVTNQGSLQLLGSIVNNSQIDLNSSNQSTDLIIGPSTGGLGTVTLGGTTTALVALSDNGANRIYGAQTGNTLVNLTDTIQGAGQLGADGLVFVNDATVDATGGNALVVNTGSTVTNDGLMEATATGGLVVQSRIDNSGGGTILAAGGNVYLQGGTLAGGTLNSSGGAVINVQSNYIGSLDGTSQAVTNKGSVTLSNQGSLNIAGSIVNDGNITLLSTNQYTDLIVSSAAATLTGGGTITLSDNGANRIYGAVAADVLKNVNDTIVGAGQLGAGQLTLSNAGTIDAVGNNALVLNTGSIAATNSGLMEATGAGGLAIQTVVSNTGSIEAAGGNVYLQNGTIQGGTLGSSGGAALVVANSGFGTLDGSAHAITSTGSIVVTNQSTISLLGTLANSGTLSLQSTNQNTDLIIDSAKVTLSGGGTIALSNNHANRIYGAATADVLDNVNNTIIGCGQLGADQLTLTNGGTIAETGGELTVNLGSTGTNTATGQMLGEGSGGLVFQNGSYSNSGLIQADDGSFVTFQSGAGLTNDSAKGTLTGGTYGAVASGDGATLSDTTGVAVTVLAADILLSGAGSEITFGGTTIETSLKTIKTSGELQVLAGRGYTTKAHIANSGTIVLGGGTFKPGQLTDTATGTLSGFGTLSSKFIDGGSIVATGGTLDLTAKANTITGTVSGTGTLAFGGGSDTLNAGTVLDVGSIALLNKATLNVAASVSFAGTFDVTGVGTLAGPGTFTSTGLFEATGKGAGAITGPVASSGTISVAAGDSLAFSGGLANTGLILDSGTFTDTAALTGGSLTLGGTSSTATIASAVGAGGSTLATLTTGGGALNTSGTTITVTGDYDNTAAGKGNSYTPFAGVTGTIDANGTQLAVVGVNGTTITSVNGTLTIAVAAGGKAQFKIENTGAAGSAALRGALQTTVDGGSITGTALSGSGVTANNFGPIAAGAASGVYTINYSGGTLTGEAIHLASDFANVAGLTIDIVAQSGSMTVPSQSTPSLGHADEPSAMMAAITIPQHHF
jgi:hypothetical protein